MTMDKSLRVRKGASSARGVLTRAERIARLKEQERWTEGRSPLGLPKVRVQKLSMKKKKVKKEEGAEGAAAKPAAGLRRRKSSNAAKARVARPAMDRTFRRSSRAWRRPCLPARSPGSACRRLSLWTPCLASSSAAEAPPGGRVP